VTVSLIDRYYINGVSILTAIARSSEGEKSFFFSAACDLGRSSHLYGQVLTQNLQNHELCHRWNCAGSASVSVTAFVAYRKKTFLSARSSQTFLECFGACRNARAFPSKLEVRTGEWRLL